MPRWKQTTDENGKSVFIPIDEEARRYDGHFIHGDIEPFISPVDRTVISDRKQLEEHNKRNGVVNAAEFSPEYYAKKQRERERILNAEYTQKESWENKAAIHELIQRANR